MVIQNFLLQGYINEVVASSLQLEILEDSAHLRQKRTGRKEVKSMKYKFIHISIVEAETLDEAKEKLAIKRRLGTGDDFFETEIVKRESEQPKGWVATALNQVFPARK